MGCTGHDGQLATLLDAHIVMVHAHLGVVGGVESTNGQLIGSAREAS